MAGHWRGLGGTEDVPACVYPLDDLREHDPDNMECWCKPRFDDGVLVHNSRDKREEYERGRKFS